MARQAEPARNGPRGSGEKTGGRNVPVRTFCPACREAERRSGLGLYMFPWSSQAARNTRIKRCRMVCTGSRKDFVSDCFHNGTKKQPSGNLRTAAFWVRGARLTGRGQRGMISIERGAAARRSAPANGHTKLLTAWGQTKRSVRFWGYVNHHQSDDDKTHREAQGLRPTPVSHTHHPLSQEGG